MSISNADLWKYFRLVKTTGSTVNLLTQYNISSDEEVRGVKPGHIRLVAPNKDEYFTKGNLLYAKSFERITYYYFEPVRER